MEQSIRDATSHAKRHGVKNVMFEVATSTEYPGTDYDLVTFFDCLHDMGDPTGAARHVRETLKPDGSWLIIVPMAGDTLTDRSQSGRAALLRGFDLSVRLHIAGECPAQGG